MFYNEITEEMWDKIEAEGIVVLKLSDTRLASFVLNYREGDDRFIHLGDELEEDLQTVVVQDGGWTSRWEIIKRPDFMVKTTVQPTKDPVVEWLDKYQQVASTNYHIGKIDTSDYGVCLTTDYGDILGSEQVVEFINNRYDLLQKEAKTNKQKELAEKKAKLLEELSAINKELEGV